MATILDSMAARVAVQLAHSGLKERFAAQVKYEAMPVVGNGLVRVDGQLAPSTTGEDEIGSVMSMANIGRPAMVLYAPQGTATVTALAANATVNYQDRSAFTTRRVDTIEPLKGGGLLDHDLRLWLDELAIGKPYATIVVAPHNCQAESAKYADYVCDGTNDSAQLQTAIDQLNAPGQVLLLEGTYLLTSQLTIGPGQSLIGTNRTACRMQATGSTPFDIIALTAGTAGTVLATFTLAGNPAWSAEASAVAGAKADTFENLVFQNLDISAMTHHGISLGVCKDTVFSLLHIADCAGDGIYAVKIEHSAIRACTIHQVEGNGIYLDAMVDSTITDNGIYLCGLCGIKVSDL